MDTWTRQDLAQIEDLLKKTETKSAYEVAEYIASQAKYLKGSQNSCYAQAVLELNAHLDISKIGITTYAERFLSSVRSECKSYISELQD